LNFQSFAARNENLYVQFSSIVPFKVLLFFSAAHSAIRKQFVRTIPSIHLKNNAIKKNAKIPSLIIIKDNV